MTKNELAETFGVSLSTLDTNFPKFAAAQLARGFLITKTGKGASANYEYREVEPEIKDKTYFSTRQPMEIKDLPNEIWVPAFNNPDYQVSNMGRVKNPIGQLNNGYIDPQGYCLVNMGDTKYRIHRIILQSFNPIDNFEEMTVDHINGIRSDNRLENLRWSTNEENTFAMLANRADLHKELTRIIQKYGYEETKQILSKL